MNATIRGLKGLLALGALAGLGLLLHWVTAGSIEAATAQDLTSMASVAIGAVAWVAYCWLVVAVLATVLEQVPGAVGRSASLVAGRITSQGSRALLRSALGVAAVTPLTIGVAHAAPGPTNTITTHQSTTSGARPWTSVEPQSTVEVRPTSTPSLQPRSPRYTGTPVGSRPWNSVEPRSTIEVSDGTPATSGGTVASAPSAPIAPVASVASGGSGSVEAQSAHAQTTGTSETSGTPAGSRPWSSVEPRSTVEVTDGPAGDWRATEKPSSIQLGVPGTPASPSQVNTGQTPHPGTRPTTQPIAKPSSKPGTQPGSPAGTDQTEQPAQPTARTGKPVEGQTPTGRSAVPGETGHPATGRTGVPETGRSTTGRTGVPETGHSTTGRAEVPETGRGATGRGGVPGGQVAVPDRPTSGAPTRYTHLQSGQLARAASHVVKTGDSLWSIAAAELGPNATAEAIAGRWPQWYEANRQLIGPNPNLIIPGQVLNPPAPSHPVPPTHQEK